MLLETSGKMGRVTKKVGKYEIGRTIGEGTFAKVKFAKMQRLGWWLLLRFWLKAPCSNTSGSGIAFSSILVLLKVTESCQTIKGLYIS